MSLPPNIYPFTSKVPPDKRDADPDGNLLFHHQDHGWQVASYDEVQELLEDGGYTHWTYTPPKPAAKTTPPQDYKPSGARIFF